jgi:putative two-component system response regulator
MQNSERILIVDDITENIDVLRGALEDDGYDLFVATNGPDAIRITLSNTPPDLILLDVMMPGMDGYEVCQIIKKNPITSSIPIIFVTALTEEFDEAKGLDFGAVDFIVKPIRAQIVQARIRAHLSLYNQTKKLELMVRNRTAKLIETRLQIIQKLGKAAEFRDNETGRHIIRMSHSASYIARQLQLSDKMCETILEASSMHDVGKIGIPDSILLKPGKLSSDEFTTMKQHCKMGAEILSGDGNSDLLNLARVIALTHHEKWDGTGYPEGLSGEDIPIAGRIAAVADVFDALLSLRPYKKPWPLEDAVELIKNEKGKHFDPLVVEAFLEVLPKIIETNNEFQDTDEVLSEK